MRAGETRAIQAIVSRRGKDAWDFEILSRGRDRQRAEEDTWVVHSEGTFSSLADDAPRADLAQLRERIATPDPLEFYSAELVHYGPAFRGLSQLFMDGEEILEDSSCRHRWVDGRLPVSPRSPGFVFPGSGRLHVRAVSGW